jgi:hypothetical protein
MCGQTTEVGSFFKQSGRSPIIVSLIFRIFHRRESAVVKSAGYDECNDIVGESP